MVSLPGRFENYELIIGEDGKALELGRGAMGVTYKAIDINLRRFAALKVISPRCIRDQWIRERFVREARAAASLRHEHIASVYHLGFAGSRCFYAMEYVEGKTVDQIVRTRGRLPEELALQITSQVAAALGVAHQRGLVHRDIKPSNLIVSFDQKNRPSVKVIDFGLVKTTTMLSDDSSASAPGVLLGTPHYASPEQFSSGKVDARSDIYSLGATLWHMLTNTTPFSGSPAGVAGQHLRAPLPIDRLRHLSLPVFSLVTHLLEKDPHDRPQTAEELLTLLSSTTRSLSNPLAAPGEVRRLRSPTMSLKVRNRSYSSRGGHLQRLLEPWDFTPFLAEKIKGFVGREWLFQEIDEWRSKANPAVLLIVGEPGIGKSAIAASLIKRNVEGQVLAYHCCRSDTPATLEPASFVRSLTSMLSAQLPRYKKALESPSVINALRRADTDPYSAFELAILGPLHQVPQPQKNRYYLLIDALDESLARSNSPTIFDVLRTRLDRLPPWLGLIATTRNEPRVLNPLCNLRVHIISAQDPKNQDDVRRFIQSRFREAPFHQKAKADRKILARLEDDLLRSSAGNFLFVRTALDAIERGQLSIDHIENLPPGLSSLYEIFFRRLFPNPVKDFSRSRKVLETVAAAREPLTREQIASATGLDAEEELPLILSRLASFVPASEARYALFHKSLFDWLTGWDNSLDQPLAGACHINPQKGSAQLAGWCWAEYQRGPSQISPYCLRQLPAHLHQAGRDQLLPTVLQDFHFIQRKLEATDASALITDYEYLPAKADLRLVQLAIQLSAHVLVRDYHQLGSQLTGRLLGNSAADVQALLNGVAEISDRPWLRPLMPSLTPPGGPLIRTFEGHTSWVHAVAITSNGRVAISGSGDGTLRAWDLESNRSVHSFAQHRGPIRSVAITPDDRRVVSASDDHTVRVWDLESGGLVHTLKDHSDKVNAVVVTPDSRFAISASDDHTVRVWDLKSGGLVHILKGHSDKVNAVVVTRDSRFAISASDDHTVRVWDLKSGRLAHTLKDHSDKVNAVVVTPDSRFAISASNDHTVRVWDLKSGRLAHTLKDHVKASFWKNSRSPVVVTPDSHFAVSGSDDHSLRVWDLKSGGLVHTMEGHTDSIAAVAISSDGHRAISGSADYTLRVWDLKSGKILCTLAGHTGPVTAVVVMPDQHRVISGSADHTLQMWDLEKNQPVHTLLGETENINRVFLTPEGHRAAVDSDYHLLRIRDLETGQLLHTLAGHTDWVTAASVTPDGRHLVSGSADQTLRLWNLENGQCVQLLTGHTGTVSAVALTPDVRFAMSASADHTLRVWNLTTGQPLYTVGGGKGLVTALALTPDGNHAFWGLNTGKLLTWNSEHTEPVCVSSGYRNWVKSVAVTADGRYAIWASASDFDSLDDRGKTVRVCDLRNPELVRELEGHTELVTEVNATLDGHRAISASIDHSLRVWDLETGRCIAAFSADGPMLRCSIAADCRTITARDKSGRVHVLRLEGLG